MKIVLDRLNEKMITVSLAMHTHTVPVYSPFCLKLSSQRLNDEMTAIRKGSRTVSFVEMLGLSQGVFSNCIELSR